MPARTDDTAPAPTADRRIRVAWIAGRETFDSLAPVLQPLAVGLVDEVLDVVVFVPASADRRALASLPQEVAAYRPVRWWHLGGSAVEPLAAEVRRRKIDLLHGLDGSVARLTRRLARATHLRYLLSSYSFEDASRLGRLGDAGEALAASEPIRRALVARGVGRAEQVHLLRPGVFHVRRATCFNEPDHSVAVIAGGELSDLPAFDAVLRCFAELAARKLDCVFFLLGSGWAERRLRARAEQLGLQRHLSFVDFRPIGQLTGVFKAADIYIAPTVERAVDVRSLLAIAAGVPVLAAAGEAASDFLRDGETTMFFRRDDAAELTVKLAALLDERASARALAQSAIEYIHVNHSPAVHVTALAHICRQAVARPAARAAAEPVGSPAPR